MCLLVNGLFAVVLKVVEPFKDASYGFAPRLKYCFQTLMSHPIRIETFFVVLFHKP